MDKPTVTQPDGELVGHTPGPWTVTKVGGIVHANKRTIASIWPNYSDSEANARLIASGPDMAVEITRLRALCKRLSDALLRVRPLGGSELFIRVGDDHYADPDYCGAAIDKSRRDLHEARMAEVRDNRAKEAEVTRLRALCVELVGVLNQFMEGDGHDDFEDVWPAARTALTRATEAGVQS